MCDSILKSHEASLLFWGVYPKKNSKKYFFKLDRSAKYTIKKREPLDQLKQISVICYI